MPPYTEFISHCDRVPMGYGFTIHLFMYRLVYMGQYRLLTWTVWDSGSQILCPLVAQVSEVNREPQCAKSSDVNLRKISCTKTNVNVLTIALEELQNKLCKFPSVNGEKKAFPKFTIIFCYLWSNFWWQQFFTKCVKCIKF